MTGSSEGNGTDTVLRRRYHDAIVESAGQLSVDPAQLTVLDELQRISDALADDRQTASAQGVQGWWRRWFGRGSAAAPVQGLYLWGGVGRGKTFLMDLFFTAQPEAEKRRFHFHRFMQRVHAELKTLRGRGAERPLETVADSLAAEARLICLDEFFVNDITDAMLLAGLLQGLFERRVTLVTTSNIAPDELYRDGLQRARFLPAIGLLKTHTEVLQMGGATDYRLRSLEQAELYCWPLGPQAEARLADVFDQVCPAPGRKTAAQEVALEVNGRDIPARRLGEGVAWFEFDALCDGPRSQTDYIEIGKLFHTVLLSNVPQLGKLMEDQARRFINLIDEFYDRNVKLVVSAAAASEELYQGDKLRFEFRRTRSRLRQMRSPEYLARRHLA